MWIYASFVSSASLGVTAVRARTAAGGGSFVPRCREPLRRGRLPLLGAPAEQPQPRHWRRCRRWPQRLVVSSALSEGDEGGAQWQNDHDSSSAAVNARAADDNDGGGNGSGVSLSRRDALRNLAAVAAAATSVAAAGTITRPSPRASAANATRAPLIFPRAADAAVKMTSSARGAAWEQVPLETESTLFDLDFLPNDPNRGFMVGTRGLVLETHDGGTTWAPRTFSDIEKEEELNYRFEHVSFSGDEGWIIGKPPVMLHTRDGGRNWERVPLSAKLPGDPVLITALGKGTAEMTTSAGAIYLTENGGRNWKGRVRETIDSTLNRTISSGITGASYFTGSIVSVVRDKAGNYVAVSSRGNFFLTYRPGADFWLPHARQSSRRISFMGFVRGDVSNGLWMTVRGGGLAFTKPQPDLDSSETLAFDTADMKTGGYGILDMAHADDKHVWAVVGGGNMFRSGDGGKTWQRDPIVQRVGASLYKIEFFGPDKGFVLGAGGALLKYHPENVV